MIQTKNVFKNFGDPPHTVLDNINVTIQSGDFTSITGRSGSGKSTLLYLLSSLDQPSSGEIYVDGQNLTSLTKQQIHQFRNQKMGFVFQFHYLLPELTAIENILMPARKNKMHIQRHERALYLLDHFGLKEKADRLPSQMSGGEQQRVAIARALIMDPQYVFADEPTGNLDSVNGEIVMNIFKKINKEMKTTIIYVTHDPDFANLADKKIQLADGKVVTD